MVVFVCCRYARENIFDISPGQCKTFSYCRIISAIFPARHPQAFWDCHWERYSIGICGGNLSPLHLWLIFWDVSIICFPLTAKSSRRVWHHPKATLSIARTRDDFSPWLGLCVGEASNPGPDDFVVNFAISNPTSITSKLLQYRQLTARHNIHVHGVSETAATAIVQKDFQHRLRTMKFQGEWSQPVAPQWERLDGKDSYRGKASGVAILSRFPTRQIKHSIDEDLFATSRLLHVMLYIGQVHIQMVQVYCLPHSVPGSKEFNNKLMRAAFQCTNLFPLPSIILGDFNGLPQCFDIWPTLQHLGFCDLMTLYKKIHKQQMPYTCKDVTHTDYAIFSPDLLPKIRSVYVSKSKYFDTHDPVMFTLGLPSQPLFVDKFRMPKSWIELSVDETQFPEAYQQEINTKGVPQTVEEWGTRVDAMVDRAYRKQQVEQGVLRPKPLPSNFKGRVKPRVPVKMPQFELTGKSRPGDYDPPFEVHTMAGLRQAKQMRRLRSLHGRLQKLNESTPHQHIQEMQVEWRVICKSTAFGTPFVAWAQATPEIGPLPMRLPTAALLWDIMQVAKYQIDAKISHDHLAWTKRLQVAQHIDIKDNGAAAAFRKIKGTVKPPVTMLQTPNSADVLVVPLDTQNTFELYGEDLEKFDVSCEAKLRDYPCTIQEIKTDSLIVKADIPQADFQEEGVIIQHRIVTDPNEICDQLNSFWNPFWLKTDDNPSTADIHAFTSLIQNLPRHDNIEVDTKNFDMWLEALRAFKPSSAAGIDGITPAELQLLPHSALQHVVHLLSDDEWQFPAWMMGAKTCPIAKTQEVPTASQIRPITVLSTLYRWWARTLGTQVLRAFAKTMPPEVTGLLQYRGPKQAAYDAQIYQETILQEAQPAMGLTLDLIKCFNTLDRDVASLALKHFGIPAPVVTQWQRAQTVLHRYWTLPNHASKPQPSNHGIAEGDIWSVVIILCIACLWTQLIASPVVRVGAYADNWNFSTLDVEVIPLILDSTLALVKSTAMMIDWKKSWWWATSNNFAEAMEFSLNQLGINVTRVKTEIDLGCVLTYVGRCFPTAMKHKFDEASKKLRRVKHTTYTLDVLTRLITCSVYASLFYAADMVPVPSAWFRTLRTQVANALLGDSQSRNSAVALYLVPNLLDPELHVIVQALVSARLHLLSAKPAEQTAFFKKVAEHSGQAKHCKGPAGCLKYYMQQLDWNLTRDGNLQIAAFLTVPFLQCSNQFLKSMAMQAWGTNLLSWYSNRSTWKNLPPIDRFSTQQVLKKFRFPQQIHLLNEISGSFQTNLQKVKWATDITSTCDYCKEEDTRYHRLHTCSMFHEVRVPFQTSMQFFEEQGTDIHDLPVVFQNPYQELHRVLHHKHPEPTWPDATLQILRDRFHQGIEQHYYTDGSCQHPEILPHSHASFSIIADLCSSDEERIAAIKEDPALTGACTFQKLVAARCWGSQQINRAELMALLSLCEHVPGGVVHVDSAYALSIVWKIQRGEQLHTWARADNFDIISRIWLLLQNSSFEFQKVAAHKEHDTDQPWLTRYHRWGNKVANDTAIQACKHLAKSLVDDIELQVGELKLKQFHLTQIYHLHLALQRARIDAENIRRNEEQTAPAQGSGITIKEQLTHWEVQNAWMSPQPRINASGECTWGNFLARRFHDWTKLIRWPQCIDGPGDQFGVSWHELVISFMLFLGSYLPVKRTVGNEAKLVLFATYADAVSAQVTMAELAVSFAQMYDQIADLTHPSITRSAPRGLIRAMYALGAGIQTSGFKHRCCFPFQAEVVDILQTALRNFRGTKLNILPSLNFSEPLEWTPGLRNTLAGSWVNRSRRACAAMKRTKQQREVGF